MRFVRMNSSEFAYTVYAYMRRRGGCVRWRRRGGATRAAHLTRPQILSLYVFEIVHGKSLERLILETRKAFLEHLSIPRMFSFFSSVDKYRLQQQDDFQF